MRVRVLLCFALLAASCTKTALDDSQPSDAGNVIDTAAPQPSVDATPAAPDDAGAGEAEAGPAGCASLPAYICDFEGTNCHPLDAIGMLNVPNGVSEPGTVNDAGVDGSRAFRVHAENGGGGTYQTSWVFGFDGGATGCNFVCDVDLRLASEDPVDGTWIFFGKPDFSSAPSRLEIGDGGWVHTGDDPAAAHSLPVTSDWFHVHYAMNRKPDAGAMTTLTLSAADASPSTTTQQVQEMPIGIAVGVRVPVDASATTYADNIVCRAVD